MGKVIRMTPEYIEQCRSDFEKYMEQCRSDFEKVLQNTKLADGKVSFSKTFTTTFAEDKRKALLYFTAEAWVKMVMVLQEFGKEVAWHGAAYRLDTEGADEYIITDIMVYPQEVTGASVEMDTEKYALWLQENDDDERFYNIHMQGHSHVNMAPNPSTVDLNHQEEILAQLGDEDFYIFMIYNKSFKRNIKIYDLKKNVLFEDGDVEVKLHDAAVGFDEFIAGAKEMVKEKSYRPATTGTYTGYQNPYYGGTKPYNPLSTTTTPAATTSTPTASSGKTEKPKVQIGAGWKGAAAANACTQESLFDKEEERARFGEPGDDDDDEVYRLYGMYDGRY